MAIHSAPNNALDQAGTAAPSALPDTVVIAWKDRPESSRVVAGANIMEEAATQLGAGLLVMGGYSHARLREIIFGGSTRHVLQQRDMAIAVLMMH
jgi:nucleotide-binding universal stress UspA family protein